MNKRIKISIIVCIVIILTLYGFWYIQQYENAQKDVITITELYDLMDQNKNVTKYKPGTILWIGGTITNLSIIETSFGDLTVIQFDDYYRALYEWGNKSKNYEIGKYSEISTTIKEYNYNGHKYVWPDKSHYPKGQLITDFILQMGSSYMNSGWSFIPYTGKINSQTDFRVIQIWNTNLSFESINVSLKKYTEKIGKSPMDYSKYPEIDYMNSLMNENSINNIIKFKDNDESGNFSTGDIITLTLKSTGSENKIDPYLLVVGNCTVYVPNWYKGCYFETFPKF